MKTLRIRFQIQTDNEEIVLGLLAAGYGVDEDSVPTGTLRFSVDLTEQETQACIVVRDLISVLIDDREHEYNAVNYPALKEDLLEAINHLEDVWELIKSVSSPNDLQS
jgi:hypothetical protein